MSKDSWTRLTDTVNELGRILGAEAMNHFINLLPAKDTLAEAHLSNRLSLGSRGIIKRPSETRRRHALRAYALAMILLEGSNDIDVQQRLQNEENGLIGAIENYIRIIWRTYNQTTDTDTLTTELQMFRANPLNFARNYSILPCNGKLIAGGTNGYALITMDGTNGKELLSNMVFSPKISPNEYGAFQLNYAPKTRQSSGIPIYFLPWYSARIVKLTIPMPPQSDIFFTAAINGCSVFIEGNPQSPTIYHAGINPPWPPVGHLNAHIQTAFSMPENNVQRAAIFWRELFWSVSPLIHRPNTNGFGEVNKTHYVSDGTRESDSNTTRRAKQFGEMLQFNCRRTNTNILSCSPWGCVFGQRNTATGRWNFYLQENATIVYQCAQGSFGTSRPLNIKEIYPLTAGSWQGTNNLRAPETAPSKITVKIA